MNQKPLRSPCFLNKSHPHAKGLGAAYTMNDNSKFVYDRTGHSLNMNIIGNTCTPKGYSSDSNSDYGLISNINNALVNSEVGTVIFKFKCFQDITTIANFRLLSNAGLSNNYGDFLSYKGTTGSYYYFILNDGSLHYIYIAPENLNNWNTSGHQITLQWNRNKNLLGTDKMLINIDGKHISPSGSANASSWNNFTIHNTLSVLGDKDNLLWSAHGIMYYLYFYNYALPENLIYSIYKKPYAMFYQPNILANFIGAFSGGGLLRQNNQNFGANAFPQGLGL